MATKKEFDAKELEKQCEEARKTYERICALLAEQKQKEEAERQAKLAAEKQKRYDAVIAAYENFEELRGQYVDDYGSFTFKTSTSSDELGDWMLKALGLM